MSITRRHLFAAATLAAAPIPAWCRTLSGGEFTHGVASGDPTLTNIILWTRFVPAAGGDGSIGWEIAEDEKFAQIAQRGEARASAANDFCVKVDAGGLKPGRPYFYRFLGGSGPSVTGLTRTAPEKADTLRFAFFSCSNKPFGYFHAYGHAAQRADIDIAIHVGDYIYENGSDNYPAPADAVAGRTIEPATEIIRLGDYDTRYASYHLDPDLQELRRVKPLCVVWDDHELANDAWRNGAQNHQPDTEGKWTDRVAAASKAYFDWMPIRRPANAGVKIYRSMDWGDLARIILLDTRLIGRDEQLNRTKLFDAMSQGGATAAAAAAEARAALYSPKRTLLGSAQEAWAAQTIAGSRKRGQTWQVLAQQIVMGVQYTPVGAAKMMPASATENARKQMAGREEFTKTGLGWNLDAWDGYPGARARLTDTLVNANANALVLSGDSHNCWMNNVRGPGERIAAVEFGGGSVTSPGNESGFKQAQPGEREQRYRGANPDLAWCDLTNRGYGAVTLTRDACAAEWVAFDTVREAQRPAPKITRLTSTPSAKDGPSAWKVEA